MLFSNYMSRIKLPITIVIVYDARRLLPRSYIRFHL